MSVRFFIYTLFLVVFFCSCGAKKKSLEHPLSNNHSISDNMNSKMKNLISYYADILEVDRNRLNSNLYTYIDPWMDVPHRLGGMDRNGIDCSGFVTLVYENVYGKRLSRRSSDMALGIKRKYEQQLKEGDLVFFSFSGKEIDHVGIYLFNDKFVHVSTSKGVIISNLKDKWYYKYFVRCGTPK